MRTTIPEELIDEIAAAFPDRAPAPGTDMNRVWFDAGAAYVVRWLMQQRADQLERERGGYLTDILFGSGVEG